MASGKGFAIFHPGTPTDSDNVVPYTSEDGMTAKLVIIHYSPFYNNRPAVMLYHNDTPTKLYTSDSSNMSTWETIDLTSKVINNIDIPGTPTNEFTTIPMYKMSDKLPSEYPARLGGGGRQFRKLLQGGSRSKLHDLARNVGMKGVSRKTQADMVDAIMDFRRKALRTASSKY